MDEKLNVLIVDDDRRMTSTLADILEIQGYQTTQAFSGAEALEKVSQNRYDCVLTDVKMPGMNGVDLFQELRRTQPGLPVILMTAYAADGLLQRGLEEGALGVFNKPLDIQHLLGFLSALRREHFITVVDDDPVFCSTLADILERRGFRVAKITDPHTDVDKMVNRAQIILLDMKLNAITGYDLLKKIRCQNPELPVILVTGYREETTDIVQQALAISAYACLYKPLVITDLLEKLVELRSARLKSHL